MMEVQTRSTLTNTEAFWTCRAACVQLVWYSHLQYLRYVGQGGFNYYHVLIFWK